MQVRKKSVGALIITGTVIANERFTLQKAVEQRPMSEPQAQQALSNQREEQREPQPLAEETPFKEFNPAALEQEREARFREQEEREPERSFERPMEERASFEHSPVEESRMEQPEFKAPVVSKEVQEEAKTIEEAIKTIEADDEGNWLLKRVWWEQAEATYGQIRSLNDQIVQAQVQLINERTAVDKKVEELLSSVEADQASLSQFMNYVTTVILASSDEPSIHEETLFRQKIAAYKPTLDALDQAIKTMKENDQLLSEAMVQLMSLVQECRTYESTSWQHFKTIGRILNDEKAKELFYEIDAAYKNVQAILNYMNGELRNFIQETITTITTNAETITKDLSVLKQEGSSLEEIVKEHKELQEKKKVMQEQEEKKKKILEAQKKKKAQQGFFASAFDKLGSWWKSIKSMIGLRK